MVRAAGWGSPSLRVLKWILDLCGHGNNLALRFWKHKYNLRELSLFNYLLNDGHYVGLRVECERSGFKALEKNIPLFPRDTSRSRSQGEEFDRILPGEPIRATHSDGLVHDGERESFVVRFSRVQGFPPLAVHPESRAAVGERCFGPWVMFQSNGKEVDLVSDPGGILYNTMASMVGLSRFSYSADGKIE